MTFELAHAALAYAPVLIGLFTRLTPTKILAHHGRQRILALVEARPNVRRRDLQTESGLAEGTFRHHARVLERAGILRTHALGRSRRFLARSTLQVQGKAAFTLSQDEVRRGDPLLDALLSHVGGERWPLSALMHVLVQQHAVTRMGAWKVVQRGIRHRLLARTLTGHRVHIHRPDLASTPGHQAASEGWTRGEVVA